MIQLYNTFTKKKELLVNNNNNINIYSCGITVYDHCHIGHARTFVLHDVILRYLLKIGIKINFVRNITDIDDKIILKAIKFKQSLNVVTNKFTEEMHLINEVMQLFAPTFEPKATTFIKNIIILIKFLYENNYAYVGNNNDVYYKIVSNLEYGALSRSILSKNIVLNKNKNLESKYFNFDFALWKSDVNFWSSPWGTGRPGWHTECAAMNLYYFKNQVDIHSGGKDLIFPHHENELAQFLPFKGLNFIKSWLHIDHVNVSNRKMSKSLFNYILVKDLLAEFNEEYLRFFLLLTNYKKKINYSDLEFKKANNGLNKLYKGLLRLSGFKFINTRFKIKFLMALNDDFNTVKAISLLFEILKRSIRDDRLIFTLKYLGNILGILKYSPKQFLKIKVKRKVFIQELIKKRILARKEKNWLLADGIRRKLDKYGIKVFDKKI